ncbi:MAG TPA: AAA family ATPase [Phototrophicaceae bacterium]|nr:AAA family ATPase [Phototrophicaceae bacterium]
MAMVGKRYEITDELGAGSMGTVYRALDRLTGQTVALKQVNVPAERLAFGSRGEDDDARVTLAQEFRILSSLRHPNIISVLDYGFDDQRQPYVTMELLDNAQTVLDAGQDQPLEIKLNLLVQVLQALTYLHRRDILHRDLKPTNVLVVNGVAKLLDFGLSVSSGQATGGEVAGTPNYMAPELWTGGAATKQSDLYAFGVIAFRVIAGQLPFTATSVQKLYLEVQNKAPDLTLLGDNEMLKFVIGRLLAKDPTDRLSDAARIITLLNQATKQKFTSETVATRESFLQAAAFVGREQELSTLTGLLNRAMNGVGGACLIAGESGVGKSRLLDELRTRALVQGALVLRGQAVGEGGAPYDLWRDAIRWLVLATSPDERQASILKALAPDIADLLGRSTVPDAPEVPPLAAYTRLLLAIEDLFQAVQQPILLILEDLHWADSESLTVLSRLTTLVRNLPMFIVGSYRDDESPNLPVLLPSMEMIHLNRLTVEETGMLTEAMLGSAGRNPNLLRLLQHETEGNAFFLVEVVRALAEESGQLDDVGSSPLPSRVLTGGVQGVILRRLSHVPESARPLLQASAVIGRQLDLDVLTDVMGKENAPYINQWLNDCADAAVLEVQEGKWRFGHIKLRDGVLSELKQPTLSELHRKVATSIESVYQYKPRQVAALLAYHWRMAQDVEREEHFAAVAGEQALHSGSYQVAQVFLKRALELQSQVESSKRKVALLKQQLGDAVLALGQTQEAQQLFEQSLALCREISYRWGVSANLNRLGMVAAGAKNYPQASAYLTEALTIAMDARALTLAVSSLASMAELLAKSGDKSLALEYAVLAINHPACDGQTHLQAERVINDLQAMLPKTDFDAAYTRGKARELKEVVASILKT